MGTGPAIGGHGTGTAPCELAVDLGTANVRVFARGRGIVVNEPSLVRVRYTPLVLRAVGAQAVEAHERDGLTFALRPLRCGVVENVEAAGWLLAPLLRRARGLSLTRPSVLACVPSDATAGEVAALREALEWAGARAERIVPEPIAAAAGAGLDLGSPYAQMLVDVGEGVTDIVIIREGRLEIAGAVRVACADLRQAVVGWAAREHGVVLPVAEAQRLMESVGLAAPEAAAPEVIEVHGVRAQDLAPVSACVRTQQVRAAMETPLGVIIAAVQSVWRRLAPKASCEVVENGVVLTGGGACLPGLARRIRTATALDVRVPPAPLQTVISGASRLACVGQ